MSLEMRCWESRGGRHTVAHRVCLERSEGGARWERKRMKHDLKTPSGVIHGSQNDDISPHPQASGIQLKTHSGGGQDFQRGEDTNLKSGYTSRKRRLISATNVERVAALGENFRRTTQPWRFFHSVDSIGQPVCLVHSPFSVEYQ